MLDVQAIDIADHWWGETPTDWKVKRLKRLIKGSFSGQWGDDVKEGFPSIVCLRVADFNYEKLKCVDKALTNRRIAKPDALTARHLLIEKSGGGAKTLVGRTVHVGISNTATCSNFIQAIEPKDDVSPNHLCYLLAAHHHSGAIYPLIKQTTGIQNLDMKAFFSEQFPLPDLDTQNRIVSFLDEKTAEIDAAVEKKRRLINLLNEQKAILINRAVTKGLNPAAPMKDSGVDWIGEIPAHWDVKRAKYVFDEIDHRSATGEEELLSVSHTTGVTPRSEKNIMMFMAEDYTGSKLCQPGDVVFNIMWAWMGALGVSEHDGIVSPSYGVFRSKEPSAFNNWYLEHLLRSWGYVQEYNCRSTGLHSSRLRLYAHMFFAMEIGFPSRTEQDEIERETKNRLKLFDQSIDATQREIAALNEFKQTLIANAVTGKIKI